jgi:hypothetical protein
VAAEQQAGVRLSACYDRPGMTYTHRQFGWMTGGVPLAGALSVAVVIAINADIRVAYGVVGIGVLIALLFGWLTVRVDESSVRVAFGLGLIRKRIPVREIRSARIVTTPWYAGWGIRLVAGGWLYNVAGRQAVELNHSGGGRTLVGSDDPTGLLAAIRARGVGDADAEHAAIAAELPRIVRWLPLVFLVPIGIVVGLVLYTGLRPPTVTVDFNTITIRHGSQVLSVTRAEATVSLEPTLPAVARKLRGFNAGNTLRGRFRLSSGTNVEMFVNRDVPPFIRIVQGDRIIYVNFDDPERTREVFASLE